MYTRNWSLESHLNKHDHLQNTGFFYSIDTPKLKLIYIILQFSVYVIRMQPVSFKEKEWYLYPFNQKPM